MKTFFVVTALSFLMVACSGNANSTEAISEKITAAEAKSMLDSDPDIIILDVRTQSEYAEGHLAGAVLLPVTEIATLAASTIPDKNATYLIYCRSGNRSAQAIDLLEDLGYRVLYDFGGIIDWPYDIVTE